MEQTVPKAKLRPRRIIQRPRLTRILDASSAQVKLLIASAGYGKTTLAEQWTADKRSSWFRCRSSSADVAVLSVGLAEAAAEVLPGCDRRLAERVPATRNPPEEVDVLADMLSEDLAPWPADAWLVIDDYQFIARLPEAERFVQIVVERSPVNLLITSRQRPAWVSSRDLLYGELLELDQAQLAMDREEAGEVLADRAESRPAGLMGLANGWPAVIGLASVTTASEFPDGKAPEELYEFFADEVFRHLPETVQLDLGVLAVAARLDWEIAVELVGSDRADDSVRRSLAVGILDRHGSRLDIHPLARAFLETRAHPGALAERHRSVESCLRIYQERRDWDSVFETIERAGDPSRLDLVISDAVDELLESGRLATIEAWVSYASQARELSPVMRLAAAELAARRGQLVIAESMVHSALRHLNADPALRFRGLVLAGQVAHLAAREAEGLELYTRAEEVAPDARARREASWGRLMTMVALERSEAKDLLDELARGTPVDDPRERVRLACRRMSLALHLGEAPDLDYGKYESQLLDLVVDPSVRSSFRSVYSYALCIGAYYEDALRVADELIHDAETYRVDFGLTYGHAVRARALAGLRRFREAHDAFECSAAAARACGDAIGEQNVYAIRVRVLLQEHRFAEACAMEPPGVTNGLPGMRGEVLASRGLALACVGRGADAWLVTDEASRATRSLEVAVLREAVRAVVEVRARGDSAFKAAESLLKSAVARGVLDVFVTTYRANPDILRMLLAAPTTRDDAVFVIGRAGDNDLAHALGVSPRVVFDAVNLLSNREREVYLLLCEGMGDREIGKLLYISPGTVKVHVHRILDKMGYRSRRALMLDGARWRSDQAAPTATRDGGSDDS
jgi:DNA-binding NarL/FixJ family response regulator